MPRLPRTGAKGVSVRGTTFDRLTPVAQARNTTVPKLVDGIINKALDEIEHAGISNATK